FQIVSPTEFVVHLEKPVAFFPAVISYTPTAIVPEGTGPAGTVAGDAFVGTGPYRVAAFEPGKRLEVERNPNHWRAGKPRNDGVVFRFGLSPQEVRNEFLAGRLSLAFDLLPADAEALRHDPAFASRYRENPRLTTYYVTPNSRKGPLRDVEVRRALVRAVDVAGSVRRTIGRLAIPAHGVTPPGLLGYPAASPASGPDVSGVSDSSVEATVSRETIELTAAVHPVMFGEFSAFFHELGEAFRQVGFRIRP